MFLAFIVILLNLNIFMTAFMTRLIECLRLMIYRVAQNKIPHRRICNISTTRGLILKVLEAA